jgi:hypothetical protein
LQVGIDDQHMAPLDASSRARPPPMSPPPVMTAFISIVI